MKKTWNRNRILNLAGCALLIAAAALFLLLFLLRFDELWVWYKFYQQKLAELEEMITSLGNSWKFLLAILLAFAVRTFVPYLSVSAICVLTGFVLPSYWALLVNLVGIMLMMSLKYLAGYKLGSGRAWRFMSKNEAARKIMERSGSANKWLLFAFRLVPGFPVNGVSRVYGSIKFPYAEFLLLSAAGFAPKLISYTFIGKNAYNPLSPAFLTPIIVLLVISGMCLLSVNAIWRFVEKDVKIVKRRK